MVHLSQIKMPEETVYRRRDRFGQWMDVGKELRDAGGTYRFIDEDFVKLDLATEEEAWDLWQSAHYYGYPSKEKVRISQIKSLEKQGYSKEQIGHTVKVGSSAFFKFKTQIEDEAANNYKLSYQRFNDLLKTLSASCEEGEELVVKPLTQYQQTFVPVKDPEQESKGTGAKYEEEEKKRYLEREQVVGRQVSTPKFISGKDSVFNTDQDMIAMQIVKQCIGRDYGKRVHTQYWSVTKQKAAEQAAALGALIDGGTIPQWVRASIKHWAEKIWGRAKNKIEEGKNKLIANKDNIKQKIAQIGKDARKTLAYGAMIGATAYYGMVMGTPRGKHEYGLKPEAIIGPVPLYSIQRIERAKSDRKLKTRALGDVFLAHQKGNRDTLRIDCTLTGVMRYWYLWNLINLQREGEGKIVNPVTANKTPAFKDPVSQPTRTDYNMLDYEEHRTFPIITQFQIMLDMYLETIEWHRSIENGMETIICHLLFRKYLPVISIRVFNPIEHPQAPGVILGGSAFELEGLGSRKWLEYGIDMMWKMGRMFHEIYPHMLIGSEGKDKWEIDREAASDINKAVVSYTGGLVGLI